MEFDTHHPFHGEINLKNTYKCIYKNSQCHKEAYAKSKYAFYVQLLMFDLLTFYGFYKASTKLKDNAKQKLMRNCILRSYNVVKSSESISM